MATRHVTYEFDWGYGTYDRNTEQAAINEIEAAQEYLNKFDVNIQERELIDESTTEVITVSEGLLLIPGDREARIVS